MKYAIKTIKACIIVIMLALLAGNITYAQNVQVIKPQVVDGEADTSKLWNHEMILGANGSQAAYRNWSQGGVNTISGTVSGVYRTFYQKERIKMSLTLNLKYGQARLENQGVRKTDDQIIFNNRWNYLFENKKFSAYGNLGFRTQFDKGFEYPDDDPKVLVSDFLAPAYVSQTIGLSYSPQDKLDLLLGIGLKETIVNDTTLSVNYGLDPGEKFLLEAGYSTQITYSKEFMKNVIYNGELSTFTNPSKHISSTDVEFRNELVGKINDKLQTNLQLVMYYDDDITTELQIKQVLSVGFSYKIL